MPRQYHEISVLNAGSYGTVSLVEDRRSHRKYAAKRLKTRSWWCKCGCASEGRHESRVRALLRTHPNILRMEEARDDQILYEYCPRGDLYEAICRGDITPQAARHVILQICDAVAYCHARGVCHRDIKPENILIGPCNQFKLGDFGLASIGRWCTDFGTGSESYMAPECFNGKDRYDAEAADVWSLGILLLNLLFGRCPWKQSTESDPRYQEFADCKESLFDNFPHLSRDVYDTLGHALSLNPKARSLDKFRRALQNVEVWTTKEELARLSLTRECVPMPCAPHGAITRRPPLPVPTPRGYDLSAVAEWSENESGSVSSRSGSSARRSLDSLNSPGADMFGFDEELEATDSPFAVPDLDQHSPTTTHTMSDVATLDQRFSAASLPPLGCSWADLDEEFYPYGAGSVR